MSSICKDNISSATPNSASGHPISLYACQMKDVYLGKGHFEIFYFYVTDMDKKLALIGNDLTSYYTYRHDRKSDIIISGFDYEGYSNEFKSRNPKILDLDTLLSG